MIQDRGFKTAEAKIIVFVVQHWPGKCYSGISVLSQPVDLYAAVAAILAYLYRQRVETELRERRARETVERARAQAQAASEYRRPGPAAPPFNGGSR